MCSVLGEEMAVKDHMRLSLQRWTADLTQEARLCRHDDVANHLLYCEAKHRLQKSAEGGGGGGGEEGSEEMRQLEELSDPAFPAERQFLDLARSLPGYGALVARGVVVENDVVTKDVNLRNGDILTCRLEREQLLLLSEKVTHYEVC